MSTFGKMTFVIIQPDAHIQFIAEEYFNDIYFTAIYEISINDFPCNGGDESMVE